MDSIARLFVLLARMCQEDFQEVSLFVLRKEQAAELLGAANQIYTHPDLFRSSHAGKTPWIYVQVQMNSRTTRRKVWNFRMPSIVADVVFCRFAMLIVLIDVL